MLWFPLLPFRVMTTPTKQAPPDWYTASQAAALLGGVTTRTLSNWAASGLLHPTRLRGGRGQRRYPGAEVRELAAQQGAEAESPDRATQTRRAVPA